MADALVRFWAAPVSTRILRAGAAIAVVAVGIQTLSELVNALALDYRYYGLDADVEDNFWAWASTSAAFACAFVALVLAIVHRARAVPYALLAVLLGYLSLDDGIKLHERLGHRLAVELGLGEFGDRLIQPVLILPVAVGALVLLVWTAWRVSPQTRRWIYGALGLLALGLVTEFVARAAELDPPATANAIQVAFEEGLELAGWIILAAALSTVLLESLRGPSEAELGVRRAN
jgi:hypothetical protein